FRGPGDPVLHGRPRTVRASIPAHAYGGRPPRAADPRVEVPGPRHAPWEAPPMVPGVRDRADRPGPRVQPARVRADLPGDGGHDPPPLRGLPVRIPVRAPPVRAGAGLRPDVHDGAPPDPRHPPPLAPPVLPGLRGERRRILLGRPRAADGGGPEPPRGLSDGPSLGGLHGPRP